MASFFSYYRYTVGSRITGLVVVKKLKVYNFLKEKLRSRLVTRRGLLYIHFVFIYCYGYASGDRIYLDKISAY